MPVCSIRYMPGPGREKLAIALIADLPDMIVTALNRGAGLRVTRQELVIDIAPYHPRAYNMPSLEVTVMTGQGGEGATYRSRAQVRIVLVEALRGWISTHRNLCRAAALTDVDVDIRFAEMCGQNFNAKTGAVNSAWGAPSDR